jgi:multiple antibiotic resistance protein
MTLSLSATQLLLFFVSLLAMFSPPATLGPAAAIIGQAPADIQRRVAFAVARNYAVIMVLTVLLGHAVLSALGISTAALTLTGGAALLHQGWPLMTRAGKAADREVGLVSSDGEWQSLAAVPLTFPITIGGGTIAVAISAAGQYQSVADIVALAAVCLLMAVPVFLTFMFAGRLVNRLKPGAIDAVNRISGIVLVALGAQLAVTGLRDLWATGTLP